MHHRIAELPPDKLFLFAQALTIYEILPTEQAAKAVSFLFGERLKTIDYILKVGVGIIDNVGRDEAYEVQNACIGRSG